MGEVIPLALWVLQPHPALPGDCVLTASAITPQAHSEGMNLTHLCTPGLTACPAQSSLSPSHYGAGRRHRSLYPASYLNLHQSFLLSSALKPKFKLCQHFPQDVNFPLVGKHFTGDSLCAGGKKCKRSKEEEEGSLCSLFPPKPRGHFTGPPPPPSP